MFMLQDEEEVSLVSAVPQKIQGFGYAGTGVTGSCKTLYVCAWK